MNLEFSNKLDVDFRIFSLQRVVNFAYTHIGSCGNYD